VILIDTKMIKENLINDKCYHNFDRYTFLKDNYQIPNTNVTVTMKNRSSFKCWEQVETCVFIIISTCVTIFMCFFTKE